MQKTKSREIEALEKAMAMKEIIDHLHQFALVFRALPLDQRVAKMSKLDWEAVQSFLAIARTLGRL